MTAEIRGSWTARISLASSSLMNKGAVSIQIELDSNPDFYENQYGN